MKEFRGRVAVITGAAGGLGREFANTAAGLGMKLVLADVQVDALKRACEELEAQGAEVLAMVCDVRSGRLVQELADAATARFHAVHLIVNCAREGAGGLVWDVTEAEWESVLCVNLWGAIHVARVFTKCMLACARRECGYEGHIVNTASIAGLLNVPMMGPFNASQHAVVALTETLYHDLQMAGASIGVSLLCHASMPSAPRHPHRHRPDDVRHEAAAAAGQSAAQALVENADGSVAVPAAEVARLAIEAVRAGQFYICSNPQALCGIAQRMDALVHGKLPPNPFRSAPAIRALLRSKL
jgi:NAD(P)-dependent dehydrogenase (short-subunit alcohol dehydrogenase family)